ncbi:MAG: Hpt domain-containing protein [Gomphosphaeria aponina SAG 52.96 = DSM 107014]|uniref:histidine kinase n=1 Tax=Gomphosphaeria aponina SAG 52.96 = DSM 107014 TaxID=1521640 RepID=A0A941JKW9_9CHRO|nr:Hpt domain-containing protein [Gomphosphaeria aponina SAG 52.96 = DSM 107014]
MSNNSEFRDQAYQFFIEEAPELLEIIEAGLLTLREEKNIAKVHEIMRAAHSIKGGAASVGLEEIKTIAHRLEDIFKGLYSEDIIIDQELESWLLEGYDCLKNPLTQQMKTGAYNTNAALAAAEPVWEKIAAKLGDALNQEEEYIPSSSDLGIDIVSSIFEVDVEEGINHLETVVNNPQEYSIEEELRNQVEVFLGLGELLNLPGFTAINKTAIEALESYPEQGREITKLMIADLKASRKAVLAGDRTSGGNPSPQLLKLAKEKPKEIEAETLDIKDQAYKFFIEEAVELLELIEAGLLTLRAEKTTAKVHEIMRAAHSIKGGAASVGLEAIKTIAHKLEDIFKALYSDEITIDTELESWLLQGYDCLRNPLMEQIETGTYDTDAALATAQELWEKIAARLGDALTQVNDYIPSSSDLGVDVVQEMFKIDVAQELERLATVAANPENYQVAGELRATLEVFGGFGEFLHLPGLTAIAQTAMEALNRNPEQALEITQLTLADIGASREAVLAGDRKLGGQPSPALVAFAEGKKLDDDLSSLDELLDSIGITTEKEQIAEEEPSLEDVFSSAEIEEIEPSLEDVFSSAEIEEIEPSLEDVFSSAEIEEIEPSLEDVFSLGEIAEEEPSLEDVFSLGEIAEEEPSLENQPFSRGENDGFSSKEIEESPQNLAEAVQKISEIYEELPVEEEREKLEPKTIGAQGEQRTKEKKKETEKKAASRKIEEPTGTKLSVRVDLDRLERMNNLVGELSINHNSSLLQNEQLQGAVKELLNRFTRFGEMTNKLREMSDQIVVKERHYGHGTYDNFVTREPRELDNIERQPDFDSLEMDSYGTMYSMIQGLLEQMIQVEEAVDDIALFARQSGQTVEQQRQMLNRLRDELMWARMLPLGEVLNRFPRVLRDLSAKYKKQVNLQLSGTRVLVDKAALEKLYDPLLHLLRNAFDHGIELPEIRKKKGKPEEGQIEISAYHQGNQTIIEIKDDGQGLDLAKIGIKALEKGLLSAEQLAVLPKESLLDFIFEPGFSTASQVSELSGRGVGLDVVHSQLRSLKGKITVNSSPDKGTTFILSLPLTLTIDKLLVCLAGNTPFALPSDSIEEIIIPTPEQMKKTGQHRFLQWRSGVIPVYKLIDLLEYHCTLQEIVASKSLMGVNTPEDWELPLLLLRRGQQVFALEVDRLVTEQELVIKPFSSAMAAPSYTYGCTILGDGTVLPVINGTLLVEEVLDMTIPGLTKITSSSKTASKEQKVTKILQEQSSVREDSAKTPAVQAATILVVDDSAAMRRTLAFSLEKSGYRVLQARDGREALEQLQQLASNIQMVICDIEMPNMNGFEFLGQRRRYPELLNIPVAMLTSRSNDKHRQLATHLGANAYFTKPYIEQKFLESIKKIISQNQPLPVA